MPPPGTLWSSYRIDEKPIKGGRIPAGMFNKGMRNIEYRGEGRQPLPAGKTEQEPLHEDYPKNCIVRNSVRGPHPEDARFWASMLKSGLPPFGCSLPPYSMEAMGYGGSPAGQIRHPPDHRTYGSDRRRETPAQMLLQGEGVIWIGIGQNAVYPVWPGSTFHCSYGWLWSGQIQRPKRTRRRPGRLF